MEIDLLRKNYVQRVILSIGRKYIETLPLSDMYAPGIQIMVSF